MNVYYGDGKVVLDIKDNISAFEIRYKGKFNAESNMPEEWIIMNNKSKIINFLILKKTNKKKYF